jgi:hypothetical protein
MPIFELPGGSEDSTEPVVAIEKVDHRTAAVKRLPRQFQDKPNIEALLKILVAPAQDLEDTFWTLAYERTLAKALELGLDSIIDLIGEIVGQPRDGRSNEDYVRFINARITASRSHGLTESVIKVTRLIIDNADAYVQIFHSPPATTVVRILDVPLPDAVAAILITFLVVTVSAGVRVILEWSEEDLADWMLWDEVGHGFDEGLFVDATDGL